MALLAGEEALLGVGTIAITYTLRITVLDPLGDFVGSYVVNIFLWSSEHMGPVVVGILAGCILHNMAEGGACLGVALRAKNKALKAETFSLAFGCIVAGVMCMDILQSWRFPFSNRQLWRLWWRLQCQQ